MFTGRQKILARYRSYHGGTAGGDHADRRPAPLGRRAGHRRASSASRTSTAGVSADPEPVERGARRTIEDVILFEGPQTIAAIIVETVVGTNGILIPPDGYMQGLREICDRYGILLIADEVMAGFGRTGEWFAVDHWDVVPDLITMAKGLTERLRASSARVGMRHAHRGRTSRTTSSTAA